MLRPAASTSFNDFPLSPVILFVHSDSLLTLPLASFVVVVVDMSLGGIVVLVPT